MWMHDASSIRHSAAAVILLVAVSVLSSNVSAVLADDKVPTIKLTDRVPYGRQPVDYFGTELNDAVSDVSRQLDAGKAQLVADGRFGYLLAALELLNVPLESQVLVYSKTARSPDLVSPKTPRAIFFNDEVSVAWIPDSRELEITAVDPVKGINFYTISQPADFLVTDREKHQEGAVTGASEGSPRFIRRDRCLACHAGRSTLEVPGLLLRAFQTDRMGKPVVGYSRVTHGMSYEKRWGGWYVTGSPPQLIHRGNLVGQNENVRHKATPGSASSLDDLSQKFDVDGYPYSRSDLVSHLVLAHQVHGTNLLIRAGLESRLNRRSDAETQLLRYFVFADEARLELSPEVAASVGKNSEFARTFESRGPDTPAGDSLRRLSLTGRVFKHGLSYLICSRMFDELPVECRNRLLNRLWEGLHSSRDDEIFGHISDEERRSIIAIVRATVPRLPMSWHDDSSIAD